MANPLRHPTPLHRGMGSDFARAVADALQLHIAATLRPLSTADKNRALLQLAAHVAAALEALETNNAT